MKTQIEKIAGKYHVVLKHKHQSFCLHSNTDDKHECEFLKEMLDKALIDFKAETISEFTRWKLISEEQPSASEDKSDWWTHPQTGEVYPYSKRCIVEDDEGDQYVSQWSVNEESWNHMIISAVKWRYID